MVCRVVVAGALFSLTVWAGAVGVLWAAQPYLVFNTAMSRSYSAVPDAKIFASRLFPAGGFVVLMTRSNRSRRFSDTYVNHEGHGEHEEFFCKCKCC
jgi:hypothetical protein